jgi:hypothetical protein
MLMLRNSSLSETAYTWRFLGWKPLTPEDFQTENYPQLRISRLETVYTWGFPDWNYPQLRISRLETVYTWGFPDWKLPTTEDFQAIETVYTWGFPDWKLPAPEDFQTENSPHLRISRLETAFTQRISSVLNRGGGGGGGGLTHFKRNSPLLEICNWLAD